MAVSLSPTADAGVVEADNDLEDTELVSRLLAQIEEHRRREAELLQENRELLSVKSAIALTASSLDLQKRSSAQLEVRHLH